MEHLGPWPFFSEDEIEAVQTVLRSGRVNAWTGSQCEQFETAFAESMGAVHGIAVANGTLALELALRAIELKPEEEVIVPARTFIATASAVVACGGCPVVVDIDERTCNISVDSIQSALTSKTRAIIVVHTYGHPCEMAAILSLAKAHNLRVIEDCAQAHGAMYAGRKVGTLGDMGTFSFCQDKIMTTGGEGGCLITSHIDYFEKARSYKDHGKNFKKINCHSVSNDRTPSSAQTAYRWLHDTFGSNFRMTEMQAVIGLKQLEKLQYWLAMRRERAAVYAACFEGLTGIFPALEITSTESVFYKYCFQITADHFSEKKRDQILQTLRDKGIPIFSGLCPDIRNETAFDRTNYPSQSHPIAACTAARTLVLLCHPTLSLAAVHWMGMATREELMKQC